MSCPSSRVIATKRALLRSRTAPASAASAACGSSGTSVAAAPRAKACLRKSAPSPSATKRSPSAIRRESTCTPVISSAQTAGVSSPAASSATCSSESGITRAATRATARARPRDRRTGASPRDLLTLLVALARDQHDVSFAGRLRGPSRSPCAGRARHRAPARPSTTSAMIASGSSVRGLSDVTIATSASSEAMRPMSGRFSRSRSPPQPNTQRTRPRASSASCEQHTLQRGGLVRVVDDHGERLSLLDELEAPRNAADGARCPRGSILVDAESASCRRGPERVLEVEPAVQASAPRRARRGRVERDRARKLFREPASPLVADVHDRVLRLREQPALRLEVLLHRAVEVEVLVREVREHEHCEPERRRAGRAPTRARSPPSRRRGCPASTISRKSRCRSIASGVFSAAGRASSPTRRSMFVSSPGRRPAARRISYSR